MTSINRPVTPSAARHAALIREREARKAKENSDQADSRQTFERYAERALAVARADEEMRRQAEENDRRARAEREAVDAAEVDESEEEGEEQAAGLGKNPERRSAEAAHRGAVSQAYVRVAREAKGFIV
ncbi:hypothetical protein ACH4OT_04380 [Streptomyces murinus]|uniref:hypothetical protein n=1 Tax=Streptomyces murinus TaxID=33900 RepID=UPI00378F2ACD